MSLPQMLVAIGVATERLLGVVEMEHTQAVAANLAIELLPRRGVSLFRADIVPGDEDVAGIEADPDAIVKFRWGQFEQAPEMPETAAKIGTLPRRRLQQHHRTLGLGQGARHPCGHAL